MYKKILSSVMALLIVASTGNFASDVKYVKESITASAADYTRGKYESLTYVKYDDHVIITNCDSSVKGEVIIPDKIEDLPVTKINGSAFQDCTQLTDIFIPNGITEIGDCAFLGCSKLTFVTVPESVVSIGEFAFAGCGNLWQITILNPDCEIYNTMYTITTTPFMSEEDARYEGFIFGFVNSTAMSYALKWGYKFEVLTEEFTEGKYGSLTYREYYDHVVISGCAEFAEGKIEIPAKINGLPVTEIGPDAFYSCQGVTEITMPDSVEYIGDGAFMFCSALTSVKMSDRIRSIGSQAFIATGITSIDLPESLISIGDGAFTESKLESVTIPNSVTELGKKVFAYCSNLKSVTLPKNLTTIKVEMFDGCINLSSVTIPDSVTEIEEYAFFGCTRLREITIPESVEIIGERAFFCCDSLYKITILNPDCKIYDSPDTINTSYDDVDEEDGTDWQHYYYNGIIVGHENSTAQAYAEKYGYTFEPLGKESTDGTYENLIYRKYDDHIAIVGCEFSAEQVEIPTEIDGLPVTEIGLLAFAWCSELTDIIIPESIIEIGGNAFYGCSSLKEIKIPDGVTKIEDYTFANCESLIGINIPDGVTSIGEYAFYGCSSLTNMAIPESVKSIGENVFSNCDSLTVITIHNPDCEIADEAITIMGGWGDDFYSYDYSGVIRGYGNSTAQAYAEKYGYTFEPLTEAFTEGTYELLTYQKYADHVVITGCDRSAKGALIVPSEIDELPVTEIGDEAFSYCKNLTGIHLPDSVIIIGDSAFYHCEKLTEIIIPDSVTKIGKEAFLFCEKLEKINIPDGVTSIEYGTFRWCGSLTEITLPDGVTEIGDSAFSSCTNLAKITVPDSVQKIGSHAFIQCESLTEIHIPDGIDTIEALTFGYCSSLTEITIPDSVTLIGNIAFRSCNNLTEVTVPKSVKTINEGAFAECENLKVITILNPDCEITLRPDTITNGEEEDNGAFYDYYYGVIRGYENSTAQAYAQKYKRTFESLGEAPAEKIIYGDANCDGVVTIADATAILQFLGNRDKYDLTEQGRKNADCAKVGDGITPADALAVQRLDAGITEKLPE